MQRTTLSQVASMAGVSKTTASLVLNGKADSVNIAHVTRQRVMEVAESLNYHPGKFNPGRLNGQSGIIGLFARDFIPQEKSRWLQFLMQAAEKRGYIVLPQVATKEDIISKMEDIPFDAVIIAEKKIMTSLTIQEKPEPPLFCVGFIPSTAPIHFITADFEKQTHSCPIKIQ